MAVAPVDIANLALTKLGADVLTSTTEDNDRAVLFNAQYPHSRDATLQAYPWNFAMRRKSLGKDATAPIFKWANRFTIPGDSLMVVGTDDDTFPWDVEEGFIVSDRGSMKILYITQITDSAKFSPLFVEALAELLASNMALGITGKLDLKKVHFELFRAVIREARTRDSQARTPGSFGDGDLIDARFA